MDSYLLPNQQKRIDQLVTLLSLKLQVSTDQLTPLKEKVTRLIKETKDSSIEEFLILYFKYLNQELAGLLNQKLTPACQIGIYSKNFQVIGYAGKINSTKNSAFIDENTFFSFDSISKLLLSTITMQEIRNTNLTLKTPLHEYQQDFALNSTIEEILKFTSPVQTEKRLENLSKEETIAILKRSKENLIEKSRLKNYYQYNDIGFMTLRIAIPHFLEKLDTVLKEIDPNNLTYQPLSHTPNITGGKLGEEYLTQDQKGRDIPFPGHTGLYGNITGLLSLFHKILNTKKVLTQTEREELFRQPYLDPIVYLQNGSPFLGKDNNPKYMAKVAGIYRKPTGITNRNYNKIISCDMSNLTTDHAKASAGTGGSWCITDNLTIDNHFSPYTGGILTNPYSYVLPGSYPNDQTPIPNTNLIINKKGVISNYQNKLNSYKETITEYALILELITEYIKTNDKQVLDGKTYHLTKKLERTSR